MLGEEKKTSLCHSHAYSEEPSAGEGKGKGRQGWRDSPPGLILQE